MVGGGGDDEVAPVLSARLAGWRWPESKLTSIVIY